MNIATFPPLEELLPHRGESLLLDRLLAYDETTTTCSVGLKQQRWLKNFDGSVSNWLTIEYMAQAVAVHESIKAWLAGRSTDVGLLAAISNFQVRVPLLDLDRPLRTRVGRLRGSRELKAFTHICSVFDEEETPIAEARITVAISFVESAPST